MSWSCCFGLSTNTCNFNQSNLLTRKVHLATSQEVLFSARTIRNPVMNGEVISHFLLSVRDCYRKREVMRKKSWLNLNCRSAQREHSDFIQFDGERFNCLGARHIATQKKNRVLILITFSRRTFDVSTSKISRQWREREKQETIYYLDYIREIFSLHRRWFTGDDDHVGMVEAQM